MQLIKMKHLYLMRVNLTAVRTYLELPGDGSTRRILHQVTQGHRFPVPWAFCEKQTLLWSITVRVQALLPEIQVMTLNKSWPLNTRYTVNKVWNQDEQKKKAVNTCMCLGLKVFNSISKIWKKKYKSNYFLEQFLIISHLIYFYTSILDCLYL